MKKCSSCGCEKPLTEFDKRGGTRTDYQSQCKACKKESTRGTQRQRNIKHRYGISVEEYDSIMESVVECEICGATENLVYDHDHNTGHHRGVICTGCNKAIGLLGDDVEGVRAALDYLEYYYDNKINVA